MCLQAVASAEVCDKGQVEVLELPLPALVSHGYKSQVRAHMSHSQTCLTLDNTSLVTD